MASVEAMFLYSFGAGIAMSNALYRSNKMQVILLYILGAAIIMLMYWKFFFVQEVCKFIIINRIAYYCSLCESGKKYNVLIYSAVNMILLFWCLSSTTITIFAIVYVLPLVGFALYFTIKYLRFITIKVIFQERNNESYPQVVALQPKLTFKEQRLIDIKKYWLQIASPSTPYFKRDKLGWLIPSKTLEPVLEIHELKGFVLDWNNPDGPIITLYYKPAEHGNGLLSFSDIECMLKITPKEVKSINFSLDPVYEASFQLTNDEEEFRECVRELTSLYKKICHPVELANTGIMDTLFHADYLLKFFAVGSEVSAKFPFEIRPIKHLIEHLPQHLQHAIRPPHSRGMVNCLCPHRFWINIEQLDYETHVSDGKEFYYIKSVQTKVNGESMGTCQTSFGCSNFAEDLTTHYTELSEYFPIFARLVELSKLQFIIKSAHERIVRQSSMSSYDENIQQQRNDLELVPSSFNEHIFGVSGGVQMKPTYKKYPYVPEVDDTLTNYRTGVAPLIVMGQLSREGGVRLQSQGEINTAGRDATLLSKFEGLQTLQLATIISLAISEN